MQCANSANFDLSTSLMVSSFKEKFKNQTTKTVLKNKCIRFYLNLPPKSWYISSLPFRKIMWLSVEHCITNTAFKSWNRLVYRRFLDLRGDLVSQMELYLPLRKTVTCQKRLSFLEPKIWSEIKHIKKIFSKVFFHACFEEKYILLHLQALAKFNYHIIMIDIIINDFISTLFFSCQHFYPLEWFFID